MNLKQGLPTSAEVDRRLRMVSELRNLCLSLGKARRVVEGPLAGNEGEMSGNQRPPKYAQIVMHPAAGGRAHGGSSTEDCG